MKKQNTVFTFNFSLFTLPALWDAPFVIPSGCPLPAAAKPFGEDGSIKND